MPSLKQPVPLKDMAMDDLVVFFSMLYRQCSTEGNWYQHCQWIAFIKNHVRPQMPLKLAVEFINRWLKACSSYNDPRVLAPLCYLEAALETVMDDRLIGLECSSTMLASSSPEHVKRIRGFTQLDLTNVLPYSLANLQLGDLTTFNHLCCCTDSDLVVIAQNCPKLRRVDVSGSKKVTDVGLHALLQCSKLDFVSIMCCHEVSLGGLKQFLSGSNTIRELFAWRYCGYPGFNYFSDKGWVDDLSVHPSVESFSIKSNHIKDCHLRFIVAKFPNLTSITLNGKFVCILKFLNKLSKIDFIPSTEGTSVELEPLLRCIGAQIKQLIVEITQRDLNSIFELCRNLEYLRFDISDSSDPEVTLVVPPFEKLKDLACFTPEQEEVYYTLQFGQMVKLESLEINGIPMSRRQLKSMIFDHTNFPRFKIMKISDFSDRNDIVRLRKLAKNHNLDFELDEVN